MALELDTAVQLVRREVPNLVAIYLFGSRVADSARSDSDLDLAVLPEVPLDPIRRWNVQEQLATALHMDVDLVDLLRASTVLRVQVLESGRLLWEGQPGTREAFEARALGAYARLNYARAGILADVKRPGTVHG